MKISYNVMPCRCCKFYQRGITDTFTCNNWHYCKKFKVTIPEDYLYRHDFEDNVSVKFYCDSFVGDK